MVGCHIEGNYAIMQSCQVMSVILSWPSRNEITDVYFKHIQVNRTLTTVVGSASDTWHQSRPAENSVAINRMILTSARDVKIPKPLCFAP